MPDTEKGSLNIEIQEDDGRAKIFRERRFLWHNKEIEFVCFGLVSSMFHLKATADHHLNRHLDYLDVNPDIINNIKRLLYVEDLSSGAEKMLHI